MGRRDVRRRPRARRSPTTPSRSACSRTSRPSNTCGTRAFSGRDADARRLAGALGERVARARRRARRSVRARSFASDDDDGARTPRRATATAPGASTRTRSSTSSPTSRCTAATIADRSRACFAQRATNRRTPTTSSSRDAINRLTIRAIAHPIGQRSSRSRLREWLRLRSRWRRQRRSSSRRSSSLRFDAGWL